MHLHRRSRYLSHRYQQRVSDGKQALQGRSQQMGCAGIDPQRICERISPIYPKTEVDPKSRRAYPELSAIPPLKHLIPACLLHNDKISVWHRRLPKHQFHEY